MEKFSKVLSRQQKAMQYTRWRIRFAELLLKYFGAKEAVWMVGYCRISFDVQPEHWEVAQVVKVASKKESMPLFVRISLS